MIITTKGGESFDTDKDLTEVERHVLQKLFIWQEMATGVEEFRRKKQEALYKGWNESGPIQESRALKTITKELEDRVAQRLQAGTAR